MITVLSSASARPNFVKLAAVHHALSKHEDIRHIIVHTGQHYDPMLSDIFFTQLSIPQPDLNLGVKGGDREQVIDTTMIAMEKAIEKFKPDIVLVYGDVNGAVGAARAARNKGIRLGHVEAGLRSFDEAMPEELNRIEIDQIADELFVSEKSGLDNLAAEGMKGRVHFVGNTMIDTLIRMRPLIDQQELPISSVRRGERFAVATLHRPSNVDHERALEECFSLLRGVGESMPVLLPIHPRLQSSLQTFGYMSQPARMKGIHQKDPMPYLQFLRLVSESSLVLTDSGGIQEEAVLMKKRCFTLRRNTERPSTIDSGSNVLINPEKEADRKKVLEFAKNPVDPKITVPELWDGKAGERISKILTTILQ